MNNEISDSNSSQSPEPTSKWLKYVKVGAATLGIGGSGIAIGLATDELRPAKKPEPILAPEDPMAIQPNAVEKFLDKKDR